MKKLEIELNEMNAWKLDSVELLILLYVFSKGEGDISSYIWHKNKVLKCSFHISKSFVFIAEFITTLKRNFLWAFATGLSLCPILRLNCLFMHFKFQQLSI